MKTNINQNVLPSIFKTCKYIFIVQDNYKTGKEVKQICFCTYPDYYGDISALKTQYSVAVFRVYPRLIIDQSGVLNTTAVI